MATLYTFVENFVDPVERGLMKVGIDSAFKAGVATAVLTAGILWVVKPASMFEQGSGDPKGWSLLKQQGTGETTYLTWWGTSLITGYVVSLVI